MDNLPAQQLELLQRQNEMLENTNLLLNQILRQKSAANEVFVENINSDEMRNGFLVDAHRKKLWNVQIGLINEFARICKKHNLRWYAYGGTLLGAARHGGFIPWDDDVDLAMLRPDYDKFLRIAAEEFKYPYYFDYCYNYRVEGDTYSPPEENILPEVRRSDAWPFGGFTKIRDSRTTMIEFKKRKDTHQGIWIDIFPLESVPSSNDTQKLVLFNTEKILFLATSKPHIVQQAIEEKQPLPVDLDFLQDFLKHSYRWKGIFFENFLRERYFDSEYVARLSIEMFTSDLKKFKAADFDDVIYLPFEKIELPAPANFAEHLKNVYGNWHEMKIERAHSKIWSANIPYNEYYRVSVI